VFRALVNSVPTGLLVLLGVGLVLAVVLGGVWLVRRYVPATREGFDAEVSSQMLGVAATLFGLLLAFVVVLAFQAYSDAEDNVRLEADSLAQVLRDSQGLPEADRAVITAAIGSYVTAVVEDEWPRLRDGHSSPRAGEAAGGIFAAMQGANPRTPAQRAFYDDSVRRLNDALAARRARLADASGGLSAMIVALLAVGTLVILGYVVLVGSRSAAFHAIGAGSIAIVLGFSLVVLLAYDYPYSGSLAIDPGPFREGVLAQFFPSG
jgi:hypothetical protein